MNEDMKKLDALRITPKKTIDVSFEPVEYHSDNGKYWECDHAHSHLEAVLVFPDDSKIVRICDACGTQQHENGVWYNDI